VEGNRPRPTPEGEGTPLLEGSGKATKEEVSKRDAPVLVTPTRP
jgi:hypothetical protein